jgi:glycosyltransferase involved in cell wall biosynthesis
MKLLFITEARFISYNGCHYSLEGSFNLALYKRYLNHFDTVTIYARTKKGFESEVIPENIITSDSINLIELPYYVGFNQFILRYFSLCKKLKNSLPKRRNKDFVTICRIPGRIGSIAIRILQKRKIPYGVEIVGDPYDVLSNNSTSHILLKLIRPISVYSLRKIAREAPAALYVTKHALQKRYPGSGYTIGVSDVMLPFSFYSKQPKQSFSNNIFKVISIGSLEQMQKSPDITIWAIKELINRGSNVSLTWIGAGKNLQKMKDLASSLNLSHLIDFKGKLPQGSQIIDELDKADLFVMASRMEGLPRAMVEAMARGLPCIGSNIGGIPELLEERFLVPVNDPFALADKIELLIRNPEIYLAHSRRNLEFSRQFEENILSEQRSHYFDYLKTITQSWDGK